jgi:hypothetical protein
MVFLFLDTDKLAQARAGIHGHTDQRTTNQLEFERPAQASFRESPFLKRLMNQKPGEVEISPRFI